MLEASALMTLQYDDTKTSEWSFSDIFLLEQDTASSLLKVLQADEDFSIYHRAASVSVSVRDQSVTNQRCYIEAVVRAILVSSGSHVDLDTILMQDGTSSLPYPNAALSFRPYQDNTVLDTYEDTTKTAADKGLIGATVILSVMLVVVSSVLLYVTGFWDICQQRCTNCLFEEVDDNYIDNKNTFQVDDVIYEDDGTDDNSLETGYQTNPSGILGVQRDYGHENPAAGLGISQTPATMGNFDTGDETPLSQTDRPLGITSMREMPQPDTPGTKGGLAQMIMDRFTNYSSASK